MSQDRPEFPDGDTPEGAALPSLEEPNAIEDTEAQMVKLFSDDLPLMASKLSALEAFFKLLTADLKFQDFTRELLFVFIKAVKSEAASVLEINHNDNTIFFRTAVGHASDKVVKFVIPMGQGIVGYVAESRQPLIVSNVGENQKHLKAIADSIGFEIRNLIALPIIVRGKVFGVVELLNRVGEESYTEGDLELLMQLCEFAAKVIEVRLMISWAKKIQSEQSKKAVA